MWKCFALIISLFTYCSQEIFHRLDWKKCESFLLKKTSGTDLAAVGASRSTRKRLLGQEGFDGSPTSPLINEYPKQHTVYRK